MLIGASRVLLLGAGLLVAAKIVGCTASTGGNPAALLDLGVGDLLGRDLSAGDGATVDQAGASCASPLCAAYDSPVGAGTIEEVAVEELSGLGASRLHAGVLYAHNDSGDDARFFALSTTGEALGEFRLPGVVADDWEDLAVGPCPAGSCVYLGDVGDNSENRDNYAVYRVTEPAVAVGSSAGVVEVAHERFPFEYPGGAHHNCETLLVHPMSGDVYLVTKRGIAEPSEVYRFPQPLEAGVTVTLVKVADLPVPTTGDSPVTGGDIHPCGNALVLRLYNRAVRFEIAAGQSFESVFAATPLTVPVATEFQGEAIAWAADGHGYYTASEGTAPLLSYVGCK